MRRRQPTRGSPDDNASTKSYCLARFLGRRHHRSVLIENDAGEAITVNGERYRTITYLFWPKLNDMDTDDMWFQQEGATCHTADAKMDILHERF